MKIFIWEDVKGLRSWGPGHVIAWADSLEGALIAIKATNEYSDLTDVYERAPDKILESPGARLVYGSD